MVRPPLDPNDPSLIDQPTWRSVIASYAILASIPLLLWIVSQPLAGSVALAAAVGLAVGARRAYELLRCFYDCQAMVFDLGGRARITVTQLPTDDAC